MRGISGAVVSLLFLAAGAAGDEYREATVREAERGRVVLDVGGREVRLVLGSTAFRAYDVDGKALSGLGENLRVLKPGNLVDVVTRKAGPREYLEEVRLLRPNSAQGVYAMARVKRVDDRRVVLRVGDRDVTVYAARGMKVYDASGKPLRGKSQSAQVLREGNVVHVTTRKTSRRETIVEIRLVPGAGSKP